MTAAAPAVPAPLAQQLKLGGRLVIPVGEQYQELLLITRTKRGFREQRILPVMFVPMTGCAQKRSPVPGAPPPTWMTTR